MNGREIQSGGRRETLDGVLSDGLNGDLREAEASHGKKRGSGMGKGPEVATGKACSRTCKEGSSR